MATHSDIEKSCKSVMTSAHKSNSGAYIGSLYSSNRSFNRTRSTIDLPRRLSAARPELTKETTPSRMRVDGGTRQPYP
ncbi:hypothetical protein B7H01_06440 [Pandoraea apista]|nr:hypothetical protein SG18_10050 [Pandoraea apista]OXS95389.1 hypothetical protein B7H01_06440 [Pandoraea apista]RRW95467.1 hypothetical protein EGJ54_13805 [Pandoraea apista]RRX04511.1 hypothetical protein EGJ56_08960 [Pandoraea apista]